MIPRIIHFFWTGGELPEFARINIERFRELNPTHEIMMHDEHVIVDELEEIKQRIIHSGHEFGGKSSVPSHLSDLGRASILKKYGGWYFDVDIYPFRPIDDIERAWCLDGEKLFMAKQYRVDGVDAKQFQGRFFGECGAAILGCGKGVQVVDELIDILANTSSDSFGAYGPDAVTQLHYDYPQLTEVGEYEYFYGIGTGAAAQIYRRAIHGNPNPARWHCTDGQLPYTMHLWHHLHGDKINLDPCPDNEICLAGEGLNVFETPMGVAQMIDDGLTPQGYVVTRCVDPRGAGLYPSAIAVWNHRTPKSEPAMKYADEIGAKKIVLELGFIDRGEHLQIDSEGFSHTASWRKYLRHKAPVKGFRELQRRGRRPMKTRDGYILVIGQKGGDRQLLQSEIQGPVPLQKYVSRALTDRCSVYFRPHPLDNKPPNPRHVTLPRMETDSAEDYAKSYNGSSLSNALSGARFVITINSTAINECLLAGVPVLAFGPHLAMENGAIKKTTLATLKDDIAAMMSWMPKQDDVDNYLAWMLAKQVHVSDIAEAVKGML